MRVLLLSKRHGVRYSTPVSSVGAFRFERRSKGAYAAYTAEEAQAWQMIAQARSRGRADPSSSAAAKRVSLRWDAMEEGPNAPLERSRAGTREWDVNLDGVAHYGLIPDF